MLDKFISLNSIQRLSFLPAASPFALLQYRVAGHIISLWEMLPVLNVKNSELFPQQGSLGFKEIIINEQVKLQIISLNLLATDFFF